MGLYQSDDVFRYSEHVMSYTPKRARILSGYWATTFSTTTNSGHKRLFAPCLNFPNSLTETLTAVAGGAGAGVGAVVGSVVPGIGTGVGATVGAIALGTFASVVGNSDIVMSTESKLRQSRGVMSHEYGHYMFCNMIYDADEDAVDHVVWGTAVRGDVIEDFPLRYTNEAMGDFFMGQVVSGADYGWLEQAETNAGNLDQYCSDRQTPCWDENLSSNDDGEDSIGRVSTLLLDVFDGQGAARTANVPTNADAWVFDAATSSLVFNSDPAGDGTDDSALERVALPADSLRTIASNLAFGMEPFISYSFDDAQWQGAGFAIDNLKILTSIDDAMLERNVSWCDRCRVFALHQPGANITDVQSLWQSCLDSGELQTVLGPGPDPTQLRLSADTCQPCPDGFTSNADGQCVFCPNTVVGNECEVCTTDVVLDGNTLPFNKHSFDVNQTAAGDTCPNVLLVEVQNAAALFAREADFFTAGVNPFPMTEPNCEQNFTLTTTSSNGLNDVQTSTGNWVGCTGGPICINLCNNLPRREVAPAEAAAGGSVFFRVPAVSNARLDIDVGAVVIVE